VQGVYVEGRALRVEAQLPEAKAKAHRRWGSRMLCFLQLVVPPLFVVSAVALMGLVSLMGLALMVFLVLVLKTPLLLGLASMVLLGLVLPVADTELLLEWVHQVSGARHLHLVVWVLQVFGEELLQCQGVLVHRHLHLA